MSKITNSAFLFSNYMLSKVNYESWKFDEFPFSNAKKRATFQLTLNTSWNVRRAVMINESQWSFLTPSTTALDDFLIAKVTERSEGADCGTDRPFCVHFITISTRFYTLNVGRGWFDFEWILFVSRHIIFLFRV